MAEVRIVDFIRQNMCVFKTLESIGHVPVSKSLAYQIFCFFEKLPTDDPIMDRYANTAVNFNLDERTIMRAVKEMEKKI